MHPSITELGRRRAMLSLSPAVVLSWSTTGLVRSADREIYGGRLGEALCSGIICRAALLNQFLHGSIGIRIELSVGVKASRVLARLRILSACVFAPQLTTMHPGPLSSPGRRKRTALPETLLKGLVECISVYAPLSGPQLVSCLSLR